MSTASEQLGRARESDSLAGMLSILRRRWLLVITLIAAVIVIAVVRHESAGRSYAATASVAFQNGSISEAALQISPASSTEPTREAATQVLIARSPEVAARVAKQLHTPATPEQLIDQVSVEVADQADVLNITATTEEPTYSARLADAFAQQYIAFRSASQASSIASAEAQLRSQIRALPEGAAARTTLEESLRRLGELRAVASSGAQIIGAASTPSSPTGMGLSTTIVIGLLIGVGLALSVVFLVESLDRRMKSIEELEHGYGLPTLASVPQSAFSSGAHREESLEPYRMLRTALDFTAAAQQLSTLLVTSAVPEEGKTTVAMNLAQAVALTGRRVVLLELDLRRPTFARQLKFSPFRGVTAAFRGDRSANELLIEPIEELPNLHVLPAGALPPNPSELLSSPRMTEILVSLTDPEGMVIIDSPPLNPVADTQALLNNSAIDAAILVARVDKTTRDEVRRARATIERHVLRPLGIVVTGVRDSGLYQYGRYEGSEVEGEPVDPTASTIRPPSELSRPRHIGLSSELGL